MKAIGAYRTAQVAAIIGVHPNTVRLYEKWGLIPKAGRQPNGYRSFTDFHIAQLRLARRAFQIEVLQNGLRKKIVEMVKTAAAGDFDAALMHAGEYLARLRQERANAQEAIEIAKRLLTGGAGEPPCLLKRKEVSARLGISIDTLRNWEMNGLITVRRKQNGYRVYTNEDMQRLKIIRSLRCANYSLEAILRMLCRLSQNPDTDIGEALNTPREDVGIVAVCDKLAASLAAAEENARAMIHQLQEMKRNFP